LGEVLRHTEERPTIDKCLAHMNEEWDHPYLFRLSALRLRRGRGLPDLPGELLPLAGTRSLCNLLQHAARKHMFAYKCCAGVLEKTARRTQETRTLFAEAARAHHIDYSVVEPFVKHAETDDHYDHLNSLAAFAELCPPLPLETVADSIRLAYRFAEALYLWNCHMMDWYLMHQPGEGHRRRA